MKQRRRIDLYKWLYDKIGTNPNPIFWKDADKILENALNEGIDLYSYDIEFEVRGDVLWKFNRLIKEQISFRFREKLNHLRTSRWYFKIIKGYKLV